MLSSMKRLRSSVAWYLSLSRTVISSLSPSPPSSSSPSIRSYGGFGRVRAISVSTFLFLAHIGVSTSAFFTSRSIPVTSSSANGFQQQQQQQQRTKMSAASMTNEDDTTSATNRLLTGYLNAQEAAALDADLMSSPGFALEQLMELAGLSVAEAVYHVVEGQPLDAKKKKTPPHILLLCGPGNNGGDGLVAARHLTLFGYDCVVVYPKRSQQEHFINLVQQCEDVGIPILDRIPNNDAMTSYDAIVDAIFGFSFHGTPREPFATVVHQMCKAQAHHQIPVLSVDVPSGWHVELGDVAGTGFVPDVLISLTAPKVCARHYGGRHFVGGRFLPPSFAEKYHIQMPPYPGVSQVMEIPSPPPSSFSSSRSSITSTSEGPTSVSSSSEAGWEAEYAAYLKSQHAHQAEADDAPSNSDEQHDTTADSSSFSWEAGYAAYCAEKEAQLAADEDARRSEIAGNKE